MSKNATKAKPNQTLISGQDIFFTDQKNVDLSYDTLLYRYVHDFQR